MPPITQTCEGISCGSAVSFVQILFRFVFQYGDMIMSLKQTEIQFKPRIKLNHNIYNRHWNSVDQVASHVDVFRRARFSSLPTNSCSTENNIPFPLFYLRGK